MNIFGQTVPGVEVDVHIFSQEIVEKTWADEIGAWFLAFDTQILKEGSHFTKARFQLNEKKRSGFGQVLSFYIGKEGPPGEKNYFRADFNGDGKIDLVDFSITLCWWGKTNSRIDLNGNGVVDLFDFSILLSCWTG